jgi:hypothetical protein
VPDEADHALAIGFGGLAGSAMVAVFRLTGLSRVRQHGGDDFTERPELGGLIGFP